MSSEAKQSLSLKIRPMTEPDLVEVVDLEARIFPDPWSRQSFLEAIADRSWGSIVGECDGRIIGYACYYFVENESHLTNIGVAPEYRRKSVAKQLLENILKAVQEKRCDHILLEVRQSNAEAIAFYEKYNFALLYRRPRYYRKPVEDALVMVRYFNPIEEER